MVVGILADADDEDVDMLRADFTVIPILWILTPTRLAVHLAENARLPEPLKGRKVTDDPLLRKAYTDPGGDPAGPFAHLIHHSDCEGYYVPVDFAQVIVDERLSGGSLGSSMRLLTETRSIAAALDLPEDLDPDSDEILEAAEAVTPAGEGWQRYGVEVDACACDSSTRRSTRSKPGRRSPSARDLRWRCPNPGVVRRRHDGSRVSRRMRVRRF